MMTGNDRKGREPFGMLGGYVDRSRPLQFHKGIIEYTGSCAYVLQPVMTFVE